MKPKVKKIILILIIVVIILNTILSTYIREHYPQHMTIYQSTVIFISLIFLGAIITYRLTKKE